MALRPRDDAPHATPLWFGRGRITLFTLGYFPTFFFFSRPRPHLRSAVSLCRPLLLSLHHHYRIISIWPNAIVLLSACCLRSNYFWFSHHCCLLGFALRYQLEHIWLVFIRWGNMGWIISKFGENLHCKIKILNISKSYILYNPPSPHD